MAASVAQRRRTAHAAAIAAKQRRQMIYMVGLLILVIGVIAWELPGMLNRLHEKAPSSIGAPLNTAPAKHRSLPKAFRGRGADPFLTRALPDGDSQVGAAYGRDPFATPETAASSTTAVSSPLPEQIVIGTPRGKGIAKSGWIVILASIPTREGRGSAVSFAGSARRSGVGSVSVLNSSNRRPLRGGYWVVYTGPVPTISAVENLAAAVHARGYSTAYIRQLLVYR